MTDQIKFKLTITGPAETRALLPAVQSHLKHTYKGKAECTPMTDFGGRFNPLAEVHMTSTREDVRSSVKWMKEFAFKRKLPIDVVVDEQKTSGPPPSG